MIYNLDWGQVIVNVGTIYIALVLSMLTMDAWHTHKKNKTKDFRGSWKDDRLK